MKQFEVPYLELILLNGDVIVTSQAVSEEDYNETPGNSPDVFQEG